MLKIIKKVIFLSLDSDRINELKKVVMMSKIVGFTMFLLLMFSTAISSAQTLEIGGFGGVSYYIGELNPGVPYKQSQLSFGAIARYNLNYRWAVKFSYSNGNVKGSDETGGNVTDRDLSFKSAINDFALVAEFNFMEYFTGSKRNYFTPYLFAGIGFFTFNPKSLDGKELQPIGTEGQNIGFDGRSPYSRVGLSFPFGFGVKYSLNDRLALGFEVGMRKTFTDYIDDISTTYYLVGNNINPSDESQVLSDPTMSHDPYMRRGDQGYNDWYNYTGITITYMFDLRSNKGCNNVSWK